MSRAARCTSPSMNRRRRRRERRGSSSLPDRPPRVLNDDAWSEVFAGADVSADRVDADAPRSSRSAQRVRSVTILFATETGASEDIAKLMGREAISRGLDATVADMADVGVEALAGLEAALFVCSTTGEGDVPYAAEDFFRQIEAEDAPRLDALRYAVLALGDSTYPLFCAAGRRLDHALASLGARALLPRVDCDTDYEESATAWRAEALDLLTGGRKSEPLWSPASPEEAPAPRHHLVEAVVLDSRVLTGAGSTKATRHLALGFADDDARYEPGDALGVVVENDPGVVAEVLRAGGLAADVSVTWKTLDLPLADVLRARCEITAVTPRFIEAWAVAGGHDALAALLPDAQARTAFMRGHHVVDVMRRFPIASLAPQAFVQMLRPLQPRLYSIASSLAAAPGEAHLAVAPVNYDLHGEPRAGVATGHLCARTPVGARLQVYLQANPHFRLPRPEAPIVMIGAGTGVAPYRGFLQERARQTRRGPAWLFFGERNRATDFLYEAEFAAFLDEGALTRLDVAFSRDGGDTTYVQHRMVERAPDLARWIDDGAHVFVCGDAARMAPDVHLALIRVIELGLRLSRPAAEAYLADMQRHGRYLRDVY